MALVPPTGTLTFLLTDIEGSTRRWEDFPELMRVAVARHETLLRNAVEQNNGVICKTTGDGIIAAFASAPSALSAALAAQKSLLAEPWPVFAHGWDGIPVSRNIRWGLFRTSSQSCRACYGGGARRSDTFIGCNTGVVSGCFASRRLSTISGRTMTRSECGEATLTAAEAEGRGLSWEQAVERALQS